VPDELAVWLYCVARAGDPLPDRLPGVHAAHAVERIERDGLSALVSRVPLDEFGEESLRRNLNDLGWLERVARSHEAVLEHALARATIVPVRLCTIFDDEQGALEMLDERRAALVAALDALAGRSEWSVKLLVDRAALEQAAAADLSDDAAGTAPGSGAAYMLRRRHERESRELAERLARGLAEDVHARLRDRASDAVLSAPQNRELSGHEGDMILNGAYLVDAAEVESLRELVAALQDRHRALGARLELSGPFPPYNFVERAQAAPA
jgi:AraC-like DNA-binding protein